MRELTKVIRRDELQINIPGVVMLAWLKGRDVFIKTKTVAHLYSEFLKKQFLSTFGFIDEEIL